MNIYRITATNENNETIMNDFVSYDESTAKREFKEMYKKAKISSIELTAENVPATKQIERDALAEIRKIIEGLGKDSYIGIAFDGCLEDAENNIASDFADSMKGRYESAKADADHWHTKYKELLDDMGKLEEASDKELEDCHTEIESLKAKVLPDETRYALAGIVEEEKEAARVLKESLAAQIAELADDPDSDEFKNARNEYRKQKTRYEKMESLAKNLARA